MFVVK